MIEALDVLHTIPEAAWVTVPVTDQGEPRVLGWHQQRPTPSEAGAYERVKAQDAQTKRASIEEEMRNLRAQRLHEAGLHAR